VSQNRIEQGKNNSSIIHNEKLHVFTSTTYNTPLFFILYQFIIYCMFSPWLPITHLWTFLILNWLKNILKCSSILHLDCIFYLKIWWTKLCTMKLCTMTKTTTTDYSYIFDIEWTKNILKYSSIASSTAYFVGFVCRTETMHQFLCFCSCKFPNYFTFTLECYLFMLLLVEFKNERSVQLQL